MRGADLEERAPLLGYKTDIAAGPEQSAERAGDSTSASPSHAGRERKASPEKGSASGLSATRKVRPAGKKGVLFTAPINT